MWPHEVEPCFYSWYRGRVEILVFIISILSLSKLYWVDAGGIKPRIEVSYMDGSGRRAIVRKNIGLPRALVVDHPVGQSEGRIYWTDELNGRIESASLDGENRTVVIGERSLYTK